MPHSTAARRGSEGAELAHLYGFVSGESSSGDVHRWELKGLGERVELKATAALGSSIFLR